MVVPNRVVVYEAFLTGARKERRCLFAGGSRERIFNELLVASAGLRGSR
jgi:hypothetical protein